MTTGIILAAITVAAALMMRTEGGPRLLGYPALGVVFFLVAAISGLTLVVAIVVTDRRAKVRARARERQLVRDRAPIGA